MGEYFNMIGPSGDWRGCFRVIHKHLTSRTITYRPARWYERLWLWLNRRDVETRKLDYERSKQ